MKQLIFHMGPHKTGTTTIQMNLYRNRALLKKKFDSLYPETGLNHLSKHQKLLSAMNSTRTALPMLESLEQEISSFPGSTIILSEEGFFHRFRTQGAIELLKWLKDRYEIRFIAYLRRQDLLIESLINQNIKNNRELGTDFSLDRFLATIPGYVDYSLTLSALKEAFGRESLILLNFEREKSRLLDSFFEIFSVTSSDLKITNDHHNPRLPNDLAPLKLLINDPSLTTDQNSLLVRSFMKLEGKSERKLISYEQARDIMRQCIPLNRKLIAEFSLDHFDELLAEPTEAEYPQEVVWGIPDSTAIEALRDVIHQLLKEAVPRKGKRAVQLSRDCCRELEALYGSPVFRYLVSPLWAISAIINKLKKKVS